MATKSKAKRGRPTKGNGSGISAIPMLEFTNEIPTAKRAGSSKWDTTLEALRRQPGKPAKVAELPSSDQAHRAAAHLRMIAKARGGNWRVAARHLFVYAEFLGDE